MRKCRVCDKPLIGRSDKIFCTIKCKNYYHKHLRKIAQRAAIQIDGYLKRNYKILHELMVGSKTQSKVYRNLLAQKGFRFKYHTHTHVNSQNKTYHYVYNLAWMEFSDDEVLIVRK